MKLVRMNCILINFTISSGRIEKVELYISHPTHLLDFIILILCFECLNAYSVKKIKLSKERKKTAVSFSNVPLFCFKNAQEKL